MPRWTADDIPWGRFDRTRLDPDLLRLVKAAALTEYNAARYTLYLKNVFPDDAAFAQAAARWQEEEEQHGSVLGRYAAMADPAYDFTAVFAAFQAGYVIAVNVERSVRGSRVGELLARCIVETGTSSFYSALAQATDEPVLRSICQHIAADEFRHYRMFRDGLKRYHAREPLSLAGRLKVAAGRLKETDDDELAFAYHCANEPDIPYDRRRCNRAYARRAFRLYRRHHTERAVVMIFKAIGLNSQGWLAHRAARWAWRQMQKRASATEPVVQ